MRDINETLTWIEKRIEKSKPVEKVGHVRQASGLIIESDGPEVPVGHVVNIFSENSETPMIAEVVGFRDKRVLLMPLESVENIHHGCKVVASSQKVHVPVGDHILGRVLNGLGKPIDDKGPMRCEYVEGFHNAPPNPMGRQIIEEPFETGVKAIDAFVPLGLGQRMGIFAGSGVGKSTLLGMIARNSEAEVNVIALIGERGRELREFIEKDLGAQGMKKSVVVVSTSDQSAPLRLRAALLATRVAEYFRDQGKKVLFLMDSVTRLAMAQREIGLAIGEPPTSRGYTPSVFSFLPRILERSGMGEVGSITALYTVLVEGDDFNEPIADTVRGILDGHILLSRSLATANHFPSIDVLDSVSRLARSLLSSQAYNQLSKARDMMALYKNNEDLINIGAYARNSNPRLDKAVDQYPQIMDFLKQGYDVKVDREEALNEIMHIVS